MKNKLIISVIFTIFFSVSSCLVAQNKTNANDDIKNLIEKKREFNEKYGYGYRIQVYYGNETKARTILKRFKIAFPDVFTKLNYDQPYWKTQVGNYKTRLEADKALIKFSEKFTGLIVVPLGK